MLLTELIQDLQRIRRKEGDMTVCYTRYSDYGVMEAANEDYAVKTAVPVPGSAGKWMMQRAWSKELEGPEVSTEKVLVFSGN